jgi:hypothetical protein
MDPFEEARLIGAIAEYSLNRYRDRLDGLVDKYLDSFPEKDWDLPEEAAVKNFFCYLMYEVPFLKGGMTMAEDYAINAKDIDDETRASIKNMRHMIRSRFVVISVLGKHRILIKDTKTHQKYTLVLLPGIHPLQPNMIIDGRIHPFGDHYRLTGFYHIRTTPFIMDPEIFMEAYQRSEVGDLEALEIKPGSSFSSIMSKYPSHWIDNMCKIHSVKERLKKDKIKGIERRIIENMPSIWEGLSPKSKEVIRICLENGGFVKVGKLRDYADDTTYFWSGNKEETTPLGDLRRKGLLIIGKMRIGSRNFTIAFIPKEFRDPLTNAVLSR